MRHNAVDFLTTVNKVVHQENLTCRDILRFRVDFSVEGKKTVTRQYWLTSYSVFLTHFQLRKCTLRARVQQTYSYPAGQILNFTESEVLRIKTGRAIVLQNLIYISDQRFEQKNIQKLKENIGKPSFVELMFPPLFFRVKQFQIVWNKW